MKTFSMMNKTLDRVLSHDETMSTIFSGYDNIPEDERLEVVIDDYNVMTGRKVL